MHIILFDDNSRYRFFPFTHTRPLADIRCGIMTMRERWEHLLKDSNTGTLTAGYMQEVFPLRTGDNNLFINGAIFGTKELCKEVLSLQQDEKLVNGHITIAFRTNRNDITFDKWQDITAAYKEIPSKETGRRLQHIWDIFSLNDAAIREDYKLLTKKKKSQKIPDGVTVTGNDLFIAEGAKINAGTVINTEAGPVYVGKDAEILEGVMIRGPLAMGEHSVIKMGAKIYGATTLGEGCKVGGEINNAVFFANSNKAHDGYLGNAVIGEWCNLGADTNCSNLKNNYEEVKIWDEHQNKLIPTGLTFCGLLMGDHSKCGINTMFNTGTVVGVSCNIYGGGFPDKFVPSFTWGGSEGMQTYRLDRALDTANRMMGRRQKQLSQAEQAMYSYLFEQTASQRTSFSQE